MFKEKSSHVLLFCIIVTIGTAVLQYINPSFPFFDGGVIVAILLTLFLLQDRHTILFGAIGAGLIIIASFYGSDTTDRQQLLLQHLFSLVIVILTTIFVLYVKKLYRNIESEKLQVTALFEHATEGIILTDENGRIVLLNPAAYRLFEYEQDELPGKPIDLLIPERFHHRHQDDREGFYKHPGNRTMGHGRDLFARKKDGREFPVEVSLSFYRQKNTLFVIAFVVDITERKRSESELLNRQQELAKVTEDIRRLNTGLEAKVEERTLILREALQELERSQQELNEALSKEKELSEIKSRFVSMASHEFRTPLSAVLSSAALLSRYTSAEEQDKRDKHIKRIKDSVKHLNDLLEDFLSLGRLEEGKIRADPAEFNIQEFLDEVTEDIKAISKPGQEIHCEYAGPITLISDKRLLRNILINLLSNAMKFSPDHETVLLQVEFILGQGTRLSVIDKGIGISVEDQQHLFSSFFRGANVTNVEGTGLGLHIVRRYAELLGGRISLASELGRGTTVTVNLPDLSAPAAGGTGDKI
jgi:PAS domain S-box-containing protein